MVHGTESYDAIASLTDILSEINEVIADPTMVINQSEYTLDLFLGSDYKVYNMHV